MEILQTVKTHNPRIRSLHNSYLPIDSRRNAIFNFYYGSSFHRINGRGLVLHSSNGESCSITHQSLENMPMSIDLESISSESQFDRVIAEAQQLEESVVVLWMARWCRKCIYLKPKLEKLAADYFPRIRFYSVDVNNVPHKLIVRAGITKMPAIQVWRDGKKQGEVIGGHKAYLVVNEVREMIESEDDL